LNRLSLNIDLGEYPDESDEFYSLATVVNIACGGHAGDHASMQRALEQARLTGATIAAHPSYPDRAGFGRKTLSISPGDLLASLLDQLLQLRGIAQNLGMTISAVKPHGALYHDLTTSPSFGEAFLAAVNHAFNASMVIVGPPVNAWRENVLSHGYRYWHEGFADRNYLPDGRLVPRSEPHALITNPDDAAAQAVRLAKQGSFDTLCVHGDTPNALDVARAVRRALVNAELLDLGNA
jgi:UPF0271 protein